MNDAAVDNFDDLFFWFSFYQRLLIAKELLFSRKEPVACHDSILTGDLYFQELMNTENHFCFTGQMDRTTFCRLVKLCTGPRGGLRSSQKISAGDKVMILMTLLFGQSNKTIAERWQHSPSTISAVLHEVIDIFLRKDIVDFLMIPPDPEEIPTEISSNPKFSPSTYQQ
jgi:hypothetical protein